MISYFTALSMYKGSRTSLSLPRDVMNGGHLFLKDSSPLDVAVALGKEQNVFDGLVDLSSNKAKTVMQVLKCKDSAKRSKALTLLGESEGLLNSLVQDLSLDGKKHFECFSLEWSKFKQAFSLAQWTPASLYRSFTSKSVRFRVADSL